MRILVFGAAMLIVLFFVSLLSSSPGLRRAARLVLLLVGLACLVLAVVCFCFPFFSRAEGRFLPMLFAVVPGFIGYVLLSFWRSSTEGEKVQQMSGPAQQVYAAQKFRDTREDIEESLAEKKAQAAGSLFLNPGRKKKLRAQIRDDERLLHGLDAMEDSYTRYQDRRAAGLPPESGLQRLRRFLAPPDGKEDEQG